MGAFANTLFSMLLGWVQTAASWLWGLTSSADTSAWLRWLLDNWLPLLLLLCIGGVVVDFLVYMIRWQPYRVWRSFLRRMTAKEEPESTGEAQPAFQRRWIYADGSTTVEDVHSPAREPQMADSQLETPIRPVRRVVRRATPEQSYYQPVYPPQWQHTNEQGEQE